MIAIMHRHHTKCCAHSRFCIILQSIMRVPPIDSIRHTFITFSLMSIVILQGTKFIGMWISAHMHPLARMQANRTSSD